MNDDDLVATAHWARGTARLEWGLYGTINKYGIFEINRDLLDDAVRDFEKAKEGAHPQLLGLIMTEISHAQAHLVLQW